MSMLANIMGTDGLIVLVVLLVVVFGGSQLPKLARNVGSAGREFRKAQAEAEEEAEKEKVAKLATPVPVAVAPPSDDDKVTLSKAELDALLTEREARAKRDAGSTS